MVLGGLVDYASSSDEDDDRDARPSSPSREAATAGAHTSKRPADAGQEEVPQQKKRKPLPKLDFDGGDHDQGNKAASHHHHHPNFVPGDWLGHVYVPVNLDTHSRLEALLAKMRRYLDKERSDVQHLHNDDGDDNNDDSLHVSLTQPIEIRAQERETFFRTAREALVARPSSSNTSTAATTPVSSLGLSFSRIVVLPSNTTRRAFFALEIAQSHDVLLTMSQRLDEALRTAFRAREYRWPEGTRYHASFAWCPCDTLPRGEEDGKGAGGGDGPVATASLEELQRLADKLEHKFGDELRRSVGEVRASSACVTVGKRVQAIALSACRLE